MCVSRQRTDSELHQSQKIFQAVFALSLLWPPERDAGLKLLLEELYFRKNRHFVID